MRMYTVYGQEKKYPLCSESSSMTERVWVSDRFVDLYIMAESRQEAIRIWNKIYPVAIHMAQCRPHRLIRI